MNKTNTFVGRNEALKAFYLRFATRHMKNGIYYCGSGGIGKTKILRKIFDDNQNDPIRLVTHPIDFYDTQNHSVRGLQTTIKTHLQNPEAFLPFDDAISRVEEARSRPNSQSSLLVSLETRANNVFIECCQKAIVGREAILLFDTFERVQQRYVGQWLCQEFLPKVGDLIVAIAGRPEPIPAKMPDNIVTYPLHGLDQSAFENIFRGRILTASNQIVEDIWHHTNGAPLIAHLILDLPEPKRGEFIIQLGSQEKDITIQDSPELLRLLTGQFADPPDNKNMVIWAMAYLRRRFDVPILKYVVENSGLFPKGDYETIFIELENLEYVKDYPDQQSHLLHDEIQRLIAMYVLPEIGVWEEFREVYYQVVVERYYPETIEALERGIKDGTSDDLDLIHQLQAEYLGYIFDNSFETGFKRYESFRTEIEENTLDYDFEELLWGEVRDHLVNWDKEKGFKISRDRGSWLSSHSLFQKAEEHYRQLLTQYPSKTIEIQQPLGFMLLRQGKLDEARLVFKASRSLVDKNDFENIATIENNLGQTERRAGKWDQALEHYANSFRAATIGQNLSGMVNVYVNRGYLYSLKGLYSEAKTQCDRAIDLLRSMPAKENIQNSIYAWMNRGTASRHSGDYQSALQNYRKSLEFASTVDNKQAICNILQHMGISEYLWGHNLRQDDKGLTEACEHQLQAWRYIVNSLEIAQRSDWRNAIADGLNRLGKVYREIDRLQTTKQTGLGVDCITRLIQEASTFQPPYEVEYSLEMSTTKQFLDSNWLERSARLFEISALLADEVNDYHRALESWIETARLLEELGMDEKVYLVIRNIERIKGYDYQEELFDIISELILADLDFKRKNYDIALEKYSKIYFKLAQHTGYATYLLRDRLRDLEWRVKLLSRQTVLLWCNTLENSWAEHLTQRPELQDTLERLRFEAISRPKDS